MIFIAVRKPIESQNKWVGRHWSVKHKATKDWETEIFAALNGKIQKAKGKMKLKVQSYRKRLLDEQNLWGGLKPTLDAMKRLGLIVDDSPKWLEMSVGQKVQPGEYTVIELEEV